MKIVLVGPRGAGKSTVGRLLADRLGLPFADTDALVEARANIAAIADNPEAPTFANTIAALELAEDAGAARVLQLALERARASEAERVGWRIREYVWRANMTQAEFARAVGTSPSRMSTYLSGSVTPSAVMLERMRRVAEETSGS